MTSYVTPKKGAAFRFFVSLTDQSDTKLFKANPSIASGDVKVSKDGGALANITTLPSAISSTAIIQVDLSATEMDADNVTLIFVDAAGAQWCDLLINIQTSTRQVDDLLPTTSYIAPLDASGTRTAIGLASANLDTQFTAIWTTALAEAYRSTGATGTAAQLLYEILQNITEFSLNSTLKTVKKLDGSTTAKTYTLNSATTPTSITETT